MSTFMRRMPILLAVLALFGVYFVFIAPGLSRSVTFSTSSSNSQALVDDTVDYTLLESENIIYVESRHSNLGHSIVNNVAAQTIVSETIAIFNGQDPNGMSRLLCKVVEMLNGKTYTSIWKASIEDPLVGSVAVFTSDGVWITAFDGKARNVFEYGTPRASKSWKMSPCDTIMPPPMALP